MINPIVASIGALLQSIIKLATEIKRPRFGFGFLLLTLTQIIPVGGVIWSFMYIAAINFKRLNERTFFLSIVALPTILICLYEIFWSIKIYPKLFLSSNNISSTDKSKSKQTKRRGLREIK